MPELIAEINIIVPWVVLLIVFAGGAYLHARLIGAIVAVIHALDGALGRQQTLPLPGPGAAPAGPTGLPPPLAPTPLPAPIARPAAPVVTSGGIANPPPFQSGTGWRVAKSLNELEAQVNARWPGRDKSSEGAIGNAEHAARHSDHNPDSEGVVRALDITHDPAHDVDTYAMAEAIRLSKDPRVSYLISNRRICSSKVDPWQWRPYTGTDPHTGHIHVSVVGNDTLADDTRAWVIEGGAAPEATAEAATNSIVLTGKMSIFGGPNDLGVKADEGLALVEPADMPRFPGIFLSAQPAGTTGLARRLDPSAHYIACRWDYVRTSRAYLQGISVKVSANGKSLDARPVDWGPNERTGRIADLSPGLATELGLVTDQTCTVTIPLG